MTAGFGRREFFSRITHITCLAAGFSVGNVTSVRSQALKSTPSSPGKSPPAKNSKSKSAALSLPMWEERYTICQQKGLTMNASFPAYLIVNRTVILPLVFLLVLLAPCCLRDACAADSVKSANQKRFQVLPGQRILLNGDSISKGYGFGNYTDPSPLRTLYGIAEILMKDNLAHAPQFLRLSSVWQGLNSDGTPKTVDTLAGEIQVYLRQGEMRTGDWMIYEDAGELDKFVHPAPWPNQKNMYRRYREALRGMVLEADRTVGSEQIRFMTMFDYQPKHPWCEWDAPLDDGVHTGNDAIRDEASALGIEVIDMNRIMDQAQAHVQSKGWGKLVGPDGIHPNVYGNFVMTLAILHTLGADISKWKLESLYAHYRHPESGGDVKIVWGFEKDPSDEERIRLLIELRDIVSRESAKPLPGRPTGELAVREKQGRGAHSFSRMLRHGRILDHPSRQPEGTTKPASYELGKMYQLDRERVLLVASLREQGGHDFAIGNEGFIFRNLSEIVPERAVTINRLEQEYQLKSGKGKGVLAKYPVNGAFVPLGATLEDGNPHPAAGTGFLLSAVTSFLPDRSDWPPDSDDFLEFLQLHWNGNSLQVSQSRLPEPWASKLKDTGFNCVAQDRGFLCPTLAEDGMVVVRFDSGKDGWQVSHVGKPFSSTWESKSLLTQKGNEKEPSIRIVGDEYWVYTRGNDRRGRIYCSKDGMSYYLRFDHWNHTVPQVLNQGLDGSLYLTTNTGPGWLRNPLLAYALSGLSFVDPIVIHDEKEIGDDKQKEVPFIDHGVGETVFLNGYWRHFILYRVCDLRETNGEGAPPRPQTGLYLSELEYDSATQVPFRF